MNYSPDDGWVSSEALFPIAVADHTNRMCAGCSIVVWRNCPPNRRVYAQHLIVVPGNELSGYRWFRLPIHTHIYPQRIVSEQAGEGLVVVAELHIAVIREDFALRAAQGAGEQDELFRVFDPSTVARQSH